jgi:phosphatidylinositol phospholipase C delta
MFARNGRSGYVLKPQNLCVKNKEALVLQEKRTLSIKVISGQQLPLLNKADKDPSLDTFVEVTLYYPDILPGSPSPVLLSKSSIKGKTPTVDDNGFNPIWNGQILLPFTIAAGMLDLVFVKFDVRCEGGLVDSLDKSIGSYCIPLGCLNQGYRHLPLLDSHLNQLLFSSIFVYTELR